MTCHHDRDFDRSDPLLQEAQHIAGALDSSQHAEAGNALRADSYNMSSQNFAQLVRTIQQMERRDTGDNLVVAPNGDLIIDTGRQNFVVATRDYDNRQNHQQQQPYRQQRMDQRYSRRDPVTGILTDSAIGAGTGAILKGGRGAIDGAVGAASGSVFEQMVGPDADPALVLLGKAGFGALGGVLADKKDGRGAKIGAISAIAPNVLRMILDGGIQRR